MADTDSAQFPRIYRAITNKRWYDAVERKVLSTAFKLRSTDTGVSVLKVVGCSREVCVANLSCVGEFVLETERVRGLGLNVVDDEPEALDFTENHAEINGIPINPATEEEIRRAEHLADDLANLSSLHFDRFLNYQ